MRTKQILKIISEANTHEEETSTLATAVMQASPHMDDLERNEIVNFVKEYIQHVPAFLEEAEDISKKAGIFNEVEIIFETCEDYFIQPDDLIPDHLGLIGLTDDAYLAHQLIQSISDGYRENTGEPLLLIDMTRANQLIRMLIGEPIATTLDEIIITVMVDTYILNSLQLLIDYGMKSPIKWNDPVWEDDATIDEIVDEHLVVMRIVL